MEPEEWEWEMIDEPSVCEAAVQQITARTRRVLDLDENTVHVSISDWSKHHGLEYLSWTGEQRTRRDS
jgi:hypothetical protein